MSDKHKLTDKGWAHMRAMLDEEMPVSRDRRYPIGWWFAASLAALLGLAGWWTINIRNSKPSENPANQPESMSLLPVSEAPTTSTESNRTESRQTPAENHTSAPGLREIHNNIRRPYSDYGQQPIISIGRNGNQILGKTNEYTEKGYREHERSVQYASKLTVSGNEVLQPSGTAENTLPSKKIAFLRTSPPVLQDDYTISLVKHQKSIYPKLAVNIMTGAETFQVKSRPGFLGGITLDFTIPHKKLGIQSGFIYRYQVFSGENRPVIPVTYDNYLRATGNTDIQPDQYPSAWIYLSSTNRVLVPVMKSHQLEIPAMLFLQERKRWRVYGGMTFLRHVWIESADKGLFTYNLKVVTTPDDKAQGNLNNVITGQLPAWEKYWQTGVSFKLVRNVEIGLFYRAAWRGTPALSDFNSLINSCKSCDSKYPKARESATGSIRPQSLQLNASYKF